MIISEQPTVAEKNRMYGKTIMIEEHSRETVLPAVEEDCLLSSKPSFHSSAKYRTNILYWSRTWNCRIAKSRLWLRIMRMIWNEIMFTKRRRNDINSSAEIHPFPPAIVQSEISAAGEKFSRYLLISGGFPRSGVLADQEMELRWSSWNIS